MINQVRILNATGGAALATTLAPAEAFRIREIKLHLSAAGAANNFTVTLDAAAGVAYDHVAFAQSMVGVVDILFQPESPMQYAAGDELDFAWLNAGAVTWGLTVTYELM